MTNPIARRLYLRIWLAVAGSVLVFSVVLAWAWHQAERERDRERQAEPPREVVVRNAQGELIGSMQAQVRWAPGQGTEIVLFQPDGQELNLRVAPRERPEGARKRRAQPMAWLRPPYGFIWIIGLAGLAVMLGVYPIARRLTQRLEALQRGVKRWGDGDLQVRVPATGSDEVADLAHHFNQAAERIEDLMRSQDALLQSQKALLANASHELRSPLARIRMALELMGPPRSPAAHGALPPEGAAPALARPGVRVEEPPHSPAAHGALPPEGAAPALGRPGDGWGGQPPLTAAHAEIARNITELDELVEEILLASRLDAAEADLGTVEELDLVGLVAEEAARVDAELSVAPGLGEIRVHGVARLLRRAVRNLLENAQRHGQRGGRDGTVQVQLLREGAIALLHVDDQGPGVPPDQRERIFEPFYRLPGASEREGGVGLGLALVRSIAQRHGGSVCCGTHAGTGARFSLRLPLAADDAVAVRASGSASD